MPLARLFKPRPAVAAGRALYASASAKARDPVFYERLAAPDTLEGRFELYTLHVALLLRRLKRQGAEAEETAQALSEAYTRGLDDALREIGVGDLSVGKKMKKLAGAFFGRVKGLEEALADGAEAGALPHLLGRTFFGDETAPTAPALADYVRAAADGLTAQPLERLTAGEAMWPNL